MVGDTRICSGSAAWDNLFVACARCHAHIHDVAAAVSFANSSKQG